MTITVNKEKEIKKIIDMLNNNTEIIKEAYEIGTENTIDCIQDISINGVEKAAYKYENIIRYFITSLEFYTHNNFIIINDITIDYDIKTKEISLNTNFLAFMEIQILD